MNKVIFIENNEISLVKYTHDDDKEMYKCWLDIRTQKGYNFAFDLSFEEFHETDISQFKIQLYLSIAITYSKLITSYYNKPNLYQKKAGAIHD